MEDPRTELLHDIEPENRDVETQHCPEIKISIEDVQVEALIDTGREVTAISEDFYHQNYETFKHCPTLPISGKLIKGATGGKSARLK